MFPHPVGLLDADRLEHTRIHDLIDERKPARERPDWRLDEDELDA